MTPKLVAGATLRRLAGGVLLGLSALVVVVLVMGRFTGRGAGPPPRPAVTIPVGDSGVEIPPLQYHDFAIWLPPRICTLTGQVRGMDTARSRFEALVLDQQEFAGWLQSGRAGSVRSGEVSSWDPHATLVGPGRYHLVIRNPLGSTPIRGLTVNARATCP